MAYRVKVSYKGKENGRDKKLVQNFRVKSKTQAENLKGLLKGIPLDMKAQYPKDYKKSKFKQKIAITKI